MPSFSTSVPSIGSPSLDQLKAALAYSQQQNVNQAGGPTQVQPEGFVNPNQYGQIAGQELSGFIGGATPGLAELEAMANNYGQNTSGFSANTGALAPVQAPAAQPMIAPVAPMVMPSNTAANNAAFSQAKSQVGEEGNSAIEALRGAMAGRGIEGSGVEGRALSGIINQGQGNLANVSNQQAITNANLAQQTAETNYQGAQTQRAQDIQQAGQAQQLAESNYQGGIAQRAQNIGAQESANQLALDRSKLNQTALTGLVASFKPSY